MTNIKFRIAKQSDAKQIASCHWHVRDRYTTGIFLSLGEIFLRAYYRVILDDPNEIIVVAINEQNNIVGFSSGTLDAKSQADTIRSSKIRLGLAAMCGIIKHPKYLKGVIERYLSLKENSDKQFLHMDGARSEYLCWKKGEDGSMCMMLLDKIKFSIMYELGVKECFFEIDRHNERLFNAQLRKKNISLIDEYALPDGRVRGLFKIRLSQ
ncbi:MAG: hypothetical protein ACRCR3_08205 [Tannerellaceae bacterium]